jgi:hypothetical protein
VTAPSGEWDDATADLLALVEVARQDMTPGVRESLRVLSAYCDQGAVLASAVKLLAELAKDAGMCDHGFRDYALQAIAR